MNTCFSEDLSRGISVPEERDRLNVEYSSVRLELWHEDHVVFRLRNMFSGGKVGLWDRHAICVSVFFPIFLIFYELFICIYFE
jgi:hypothetical protein